MKVPCACRPTVERRSALPLLLALAVCAAGCGGGGASGGSSSPSATPTPVVSPTATPTPTPGPTATPTPTPTPNPTPVPTPTPTPTPVPVVVTVTPAAVTLSVGDGTTLSASVTGTDNGAVTWSVRESGGGTLTADGKYTAPQTAGVYHAVATSQADTTRTGVVIVNVQSGSATGTIQ